MAILHKDNSVTMNGRDKIGTWSRRYNGRVDRGVKLGAWVGTLPNGVRATFDTKRELVDWFDHNSEPSSDA
jgi:hypothetical protein